MTRRGTTRRYPRSARANEVVREVLAEDLERMSDPRLEVVTITGVEVSSDVRYADVYYSTLGTPEQAEAAARGAEVGDRALAVAARTRGAVPVHPRAALARRPGDRAGRADRSRDQVAA
jgi:ribosome-binding factor A